jgi:metallo-beta-lactamase family protein
MRITFHGAAQTVTGSKHLIEVGGKTILLDCGLYQGKRSESYDRNHNFKFNPADVDALVLSHAHIDHCGNIPNLVKRGFKGRIICTEATVDLCKSMLPDSGRIQEKDVEFVNKKRKRKGEKPVLPIYTEIDAVNALELFAGVSYQQPTTVADGVTVTFFDAGHMLGSSIVVLEINDEGRKRQVVFSGDVGRPNVPILRDPTFIDKADILIMESTYGGKTHPPIEESAERMRQIIVEAAERRGKVIIPAFAVERTQMLVYMLNSLFNAGRLPDIPVYVDSPLAVDVTAAFRANPEYFDNETMEALKQDPDGDVFGFGRLRYIRDVEQSKALNMNPDPCVIISASGMAEAGRIQHHLKNNIENPNNTVLIVGYMAPDTLGRRLVEHQPKVRIFGEEYQLKAQVIDIGGFSGHADHPGLLGWANAFKQRPERIFLVHGEIDPAKTLAGALRNDAGYKNVEIPAMYQSFDL